MPTRSCCNPDGANRKTSESNSNAVKNFATVKTWMKEFESSESLNTVLYLSKQNSLEQKDHLKE